MQRVIQLPKAMEELRMKCSASWSKSPSSFRVSSEPVISLSTAVFDHQVGQQSNQEDAHHRGPNDDGNNSLVEVSPTLHL